MAVRVGLIVLSACLFAACGPSFDERHMDGIDLSSATVNDFRSRYGPEEERTEMFMMGVPVFHRLRFRLRHEDAARFTTAPSGPLFVDEGSSHNAIRVWIPLPKLPRSFDDAKDKWGEPATQSVIDRSASGNLPTNLTGLWYAEFQVNDMEVGVFYEGESSRIAMLTWAPHSHDTDASAEPDLPQGGASPAPTN
jgi:hypothetical protein